MGHIVNATSLRVKNIWSSFWYLKKIKNKDTLSIQDFIIKKYILNIYKTQNRLISNFNIFRNLNNILIFLSCISWRRKKKQKNSQNFKTNKKKKKSYQLNNFKNLKPLGNVLLHVEKNIKKLFFFNSVKIIEKRIHFNRFLTYGLKNVYFLRYNDLYFFKVLTLSLFESSPLLLVNGISKFLPLSKRHMPFIKKLKRTLNDYAQTNLKKLSLKGFRIEFNGRFDGRKRAKKIVFGRGAMPYSQINTNILYSFSHIFTKYGVYGIKVWFFVFNKQYYKNRILNFKKFNKFLVNLKCTPNQKKQNLKKKKKVK